MTDNLVLVLATISLQGLRAGRYAWVDPDDPWMAEALKQTWIVRVSEPVDVRADAEAAGADVIITTADGEPVGFVAPADEPAAPDDRLPA